ncbi:MAG: hypothetical protein M1434_11110 [Chloroflexi bacterium]|nr:hypothetical protein [Chloroflexota bacterium]MCL5275273.1 hypothetical protein [Chloroflexota bacterium]
MQTDDGALTQTVGVTSGAANPLLVVHLVYGGTGTHFANSGVAAWERTFYDGLGRVIETQSSGVDGAGSKDKLTWTLYDGQGRAYAQSAPYFTSPYAYTTTVVSGVVSVQSPYQPPDLSQPRTTTQHDVLGRVVGASGPDGETTTTSYLTGADGAQTTLSIDPLYHRRASVSDLLGRVTAVREYTATPWIREAETLDGVAVGFLGYTTTNAVVTKPPPVTVDPTDHFIYGPGLDLPAPVAAPGQVAQFRLAISDTTGADAYVANINVHDVISGDVIALRWLHRSEFRGGLTNFTEFALPFDTTGRLGHGLELRVWWAGNSQMAVDRTTLYWSSTPSQTTQYRYDARDKLTGVTDALSNTTVITYDALGRKTGMADSDMGGWGYGYDPVGNLVTQTDALSQTLWFGYDALNRLTEKRLSNSSGALLAQYGYDQGANGLGRRTSISNTNAATVWTYDARGRVATEENTLAGVTGTFASLLQYDDANRLIWTRLPNGEIVTATYNAAGQAQGLYAGSMGLVTGATYNALGLSQVITFGNGVTTTYTYRSDNFHLQRIQVGANLLDRQYGYDAVGNITSINDAVNGENQSYTYDPLNRLTSVSGAYTETYSYDAVGNIMSKAGLTYSYTNALHKHAVTALSNGSLFQYDANGNMTQRVEGGVTYTQTWDSDNRLASVTKGSQTTSYFYDADGALVRKVEPRGMTVYAGADYEVFSATVVTTGIPITFTRVHTLYLPMAFGAPPAGACQSTCQYYQFNGARVAVRTGGSVYWLHDDHLGSASATTDINGAKVSELRYTPYGETRYSFGSMPTDLRFTSQEEQAGIGLYNYGARFYDPQIGRFLSADSIVPRPGDPQSLNRYSYVRNSPLVRIDSSGHADCSAGDTACWTSEWMWKNRWFEAHGKFWDGGGWNKQDNANFRDWDILRDTLGEVGILGTNGSADWLFDELTTVAQGVVALMNKVGGSGRLQALLGSTVYFIRDHNACFSGMGGGIACVQNFRDEVRFPDILFGRLPGIYPAGDPGKLADPYFIRGTAVHELAHVMDFRGQFFAPIGKNYGDRIPKGESLGTYANTNQWGAEYFADAVAGWVYNTPDGNWLRLYRDKGPGAIPSSIVNFLNNELAVHP